MSPATIFQIHLLLGYVPWLLCFGAYAWPRLKAMKMRRFLWMRQPLLGRVATARKRLPPGRLRSSDFQVFDNEASLRLQMSMAW
jgi:hypothetical protein